MHLGREAADRAAKLPDDDRHDAIVYVLTTRPADILAAVSDSKRLGLDRTGQDANRHETWAQAVNRTDRTTSPRLRIRWSAVTLPYSDPYSQTRPLLPTIADNDGRLTRCTTR